VVRKGEKENKDIFAPQTLLMPSSVGITSELRRNPNAIGYDGFGYVDSAHEKLIAIARDANQPYIVPSVAAGADGSYPISRGLYMYTAGEPTGPIRAYLDWILGAEGQAIVAELGFVPLPKE
jgi:phosphate transport system substrate-binding protein